MERVSVVIRIEIKSCMWMLLRVHDSFIMMEESVGRLKAIRAIAVRKAERAVHKEITEKYLL